MGKLKLDKTFKLGCFIYVLQKLEIFRQKLDEFAIKLEAELKKWMILELEMLKFDET